MGGSSPHQLCEIVLHVASLGTPQILQMKKGYGLGGCALPPFKNQMLLENKLRKLSFEGLPHSSASEACLFDRLRAVVPLILSEDKCKEPSDANLSVVCTHSCHKAKMVMRAEMVMVMMTATMATMFTGMAKSKNDDDVQCRVASCTCQ